MKFKGVNMKNLTKKIIETIVWSIAIVIVALLSGNYFLALFDMDDDLMFITGFTLMVITCTVVLFLILSCFISSIWKDKDDKNKNVK